MNKTTIKELQKLFKLCMEINSKTNHDASFMARRYPSGNERFEVSIGENKSVHNTYLTDIAGDLVTLPNINKCRQKLLKYKEW